MEVARVLITAPTADVVSLADCKAALGISTSGQDAMITAALAAVSQALDPATGGWLGRALRPQTWELRLSQFPCGKIDLPYPVLTEVASVKYDDQAGVEQTLDIDTGYRVFGLGGHNKAYVAPAYNQSWPSARCDREAVRIRFVCGYAPAVPASPGPASADMLPAPIKQAIILSVRMILSNVERNLYLSSDKVDEIGEKRYVVSYVANELVKRASEGLLSAYRVW